MKIGKTYRFEAAHFLPNVPDGHKCKNMHGHNYKVEIVVEGEWRASGFVLDFFDLDKLVLPLTRKLDHKVLNEVGIYNPTAERIAEWFMVELNCHSVKVYENDDCWAMVEND